MSEPLLSTELLRKLDRLALLTRRALPGDLQGERRSPRRGSSVEFADFRAYTPGDDIRQVDWNLYARMERVFLKLYVAEEELTAHLLVDTSASMDWGEPNKLLYAKRAAAAFGYIVLSSLDRVTVTAIGAGRQMPAVRGRRGAIPLFQFLQALPSSGATSLADAAKRFVRTARSPGPLLLCSDLLDAHWEDALRALTARQFEVTLLHTLAPQELRPDLDGDFRLIDAESGEPVEVTADLETLQRYDAQLAAWRAEVEGFCAGRNINYIAVDTSVPLDTLVTQTMRRRGVLK